MERIPAEEIAFHPHSFLDEAGQPFKWRGDIYRGIAPAWAPFFRQLCDDGTIGELVGRGLLVQSEIAPLSADGFALVLRHRKVPFATYPREWSPSMFRDAVLTVIDLWIALAERGLSLKDAHPWNILFDGCQPVWVDLTSIVPLDRPWTEQPHLELRNTCLAPLKLMQQGRSRIARAVLPMELSAVELALLVQPFRGRVANWSRARAEDLGRALPRKLWNFSWRIARRLDPPTQKRLLGFLRAMREECAGVRFAPSQPVPATHRFGVEIAEVVQRLNPASVLDLGAESSGDLLGSREIVRFESEEMAADHLYLLHRGSGRRVLPVVMDFVNSTPASGLADHRYIAATARFRCEGVVAPGLVTEAFIGYGRVGLTEIAGGLAQFAKKWALVDFTPAAGNGRRPYSAEALRHALGERFESVTKLKTDPDGSELFLCEHGEDSA